MKYIFLLPLLLLVIAPTTAVMMTPPTTPAFASTGMSNCTEEPDNEDCNPQPDRVGNDHDEDNEVNRDGPDDEGDSNCWGKVTSDFTTTKDGDGGGDMSHASDPVRGDDDRETPREGVGNQDEDHPSDHADTVGPQFGSDEECIDEGNPDGE
jgi:hypothetical protein